jgi:hypothetical protein
MRDTIVVEVDHRSIRTKEESVRMRESRTDKSLRRVLDQKRAWQQGFEAGLLARGTRDMVAPDEEPTAPYPLVDLKLID